MLPATGKVERLSEGNGLLHPAFAANESSILRKDDNNVPVSLIKEFYDMPQWLYLFAFSGGGMGGGGWYQPAVSSSIPCVL